MKNLIIYEIFANGDDECLGESLSKVFVTFIVKMLFVFIAKPGSIINTVMYLPHLQLILPLSYLTQKKKYPLNKIKKKKHSNIILKC